MEQWKTKVFSQTKKKVQPTPKEIEDSEQLIALMESGQVTNKNIERNDLIFHFIIEMLLIWVIVGGICWILLTLI